jgi:glycosyltransferase involved in cell wall biosynthesis
MRIVQLLPELNEGGVERGVVDLNRELVQRGHQSLVLSAGGKLAPQIEAAGGRHVELDLAGKNPLTAWPRVLQLRRLLRELQPDVVHARSRVPAWLAWLANRALGLPFVTTVHGFNSVNAYSKVMTYGDRVICVSGAIRDYVRQHYGVAEAKLRVIPRGIDLGLFDPARLDQDFMQQFRQRYRLEGRCVISSVGRVTQLKDYETLIAALVELKKQLPQLTGLIVGGVREDKQDYFARLQAQVRSAGAEDYIHFTGSQAKVAEIYALSQVVVCSSKKPESFGRAAAEALAMNVPVVATGHGGMLDIVLEGRTGYLFNPGDVATLTARLQQAADQRWSGLRPFVVEQFSLGQMVDKTLAVYGELASPGAGRA